MSPSLNDLPDLCLLAVFKYLSLLELLRTIRLVNTRWSQQLLPTELNRRRSLVIVDDRGFNLSEAKLDQYGSVLIEHVKQDDGLTPWSRLPQFDSWNMVHNRIQPKMITTLLVNLPQITSLTVVQRIVNLYSLNQITRLIDHLANHLVTLKLYLQQHPHYPGACIGIREDQLGQLRAQIVALFGSINRAPALKHLTLNMEYFDFNDSPLVSPFSGPLTMLSRLSTLHLDSLNLSKYIYDSLIPYASHNHNIQIGTKDRDINFEQLQRIEPQFCARFYYVEMMLPRDVIFEDLNRFCTRFSSLVYLSIYNRGSPITRIVQCLVHLTQLVHLATLVDVYPLEDNPPWHPLPELALDQLVPLPSVRLLSITVFFTTHNSTELLHLPELFPNVQVLSLVSLARKCPDCGFNEENFGAKVAQVRQCSRLARQPFRRFPRLHTIEIDANDSRYFSNRKMKLITIDEL